MIGVAAYLVFVCALFPVQRGMRSGYSHSTYLAALGKTHTQIKVMLPHRS